MEQKKQFTFYDPASGWLYGFPKPYRPLPHETLAETLIRDGYPEKDAKLISEGKLWCRFLAPGDV